MAVMKLCSIHIADGIASNKADVSTSAAVGVIQALYTTTTVSPVPCNVEGLHR